MSRPMTFQEFVDVIKHIAANNGPFAYGAGTMINGVRIPVVKYANPTLDFRSNTVSGIAFRGFGSEILFHCQNECRDMKASLKERVMAYLSGHEIIEDQTIRQVTLAIHEALETDAEFYWLSTHNRAQYVK